MHVLIVDDNQDIRLLVRLILSRAGISTSEAGGGLEALDMLRGAERPDLVVLDVQMPDVDGWETLQAIRAEPRVSEVPILLCTVKGSLRDEVRGWELGCDGYLAKPFTLSRLSTEVQAVAGRDRTEREHIRRTSLEAARLELGALTNT